MDFSELINALIPLSFLAIWALTSLLNREARPAAEPRRGPPVGGPPRPVRPAAGPRGGDGGFGHDAGGGRHVMGPSWSPTLEDDPRGHRPSGGADEEIVILPPPARAPQPQPVPRSVLPQTAAPRTRRTPRPKPVAPGQPPATPSPAAAPQRSLAGGARTSSVLPIAPQTESTPSASSHPLGIDLANVTRSPEQLRQAFVLQEVFRPPVSRRPRHRGGL